MTRDGFIDKYGIDGSKQAVADLDALLAAERERYAKELLKACASKMADEYGDDAEPCGSEDCGYCDGAKVVREALPR